LQRQTAQEMALDDQIVSEFFASQSQKVAPLALAPIADAQPIHLVTRKSVPAAMDMRPQRPVMDAEQLRAQARARRDQQVAARAAAFNGTALRPFTDIR